MMRVAFDLIRRFRSDERGAFAMIFTVLFIVLVATSGAVVDFTSMEQARTRAQVALDAAALALQPKIYTDTNSQLKAYAQNLVVDRLNDQRNNWSKCTTQLDAPCVNVDSAVTNTTDGTLTLQAQLSVPMYFVSLVGVQKLNLRIQSQSTRKKINLEVAMVLDNTGSMTSRMDSGDTRMKTLQDAADCATNILFYGVKDCTTSVTGLTKNDNVKVGVVPFSSEVNVGSANASASWLDRTGSSSDSITQDNFDSDDNSSTTFNGPVDRVALFSKFTDKSGNTMSWGGCVEARKSPYDTTDDAPVSGSDTMFTPLFAPDEPDTSSSYNNDYLSDTPDSCPVVPQCVKEEVKSNCSSSNYDNCGSSPTTTITNTASDRTVTHPGSCSSSGAQISSDDSYSRHGWRGNYVYTNTRTTTYTYPPYSLSDRVLQERLCKYNGATMKSNPNPGNGFGPNSDCPATPILPLTDTPSSVTSEIAAMTARGATNIHEGTAWGWRVLSPGAPFTQGLPYDQGTSKVIILMTDGENTAYSTNNMNGTWLYQAYGYPWDNKSSTHTRLGQVGWSSSQLASEMNTRLLATCTNAKAAGVTIYAIGVATSDTSNPTANKQMLTQCATDSSKAYFPESASDLVDAFKSIANELAALRLSK